MNAAAEDRVASESRRFMWRNIIVMIFVEMRCECEVFSFLTDRYFSELGRFIPAVKDTLVLVSIFAN